ncbi:hypothetical protein [Kribbella sp. CA-294648]|uniref:hypothetical protein n=1 Tax=Kribbella sp. CA-294648 TaxID=3239948 RepID=UPI003D90148D
MRRCRYCTQRPEGDVDEVTLRLRALWTVLVTDPATASEPELVDEQLLDWLAAAGSSRPARLPSPPRVAGQAAHSPGRRSAGCRSRI